MIGSDPRIRIRISLGAASALLGGILISTGCRADPKPAPLVTPAVQSGTELFLGSPLAGPTARLPAATQPSTLPATEPLAVEVAWYSARSRIPGNAASTSLGSRASLVVTSDDVRPWQATPRQLANVRLFTGDSALKLADALSTAPPSAAVVLSRDTGIVRDGLTAAFTLEGASRSIRAFLTPSHADGQPILELAVAAEEPEAGREIVLTEWPRDLGGAGTVVLRFPESPDGGQSLFLVLAVRPAEPDGRDTELAARASALLSGTASTTAASQAVAWNAPGSSAVAYAGAAAAMADAGTRRAALAFLARETQASLTEEVALSADEKLLETLAERLSARWQAGLPAPTAMAFELERETLTALAEMEDGGTLPPEMRTLLTLHAGEAGRRAASLEEALGAATSVPELRSRLAAENAIYLEDSDAAARVRAYEWLAARGLAPEGYDPLAPVESRRAALEAAMNAAATQSSTQPSSATEGVP